MTRTQRELEGQVAIVTGSAKNIGRAINLELAQAGAKVVINANTSAEEAKALAGEINALGGEAMHHLADIRDPRAVQAMIDATVTRFGGIKIVINTASLRQLAPLAEMTLVRALCGPAGRYVTGQTICANGRLYLT